MPASRPNALLRVLGSNLRDARERAALTQAAVAEAVGCELTYLQKLEYGTSAPSLRLLSLIAGALDTEVWRLLKPSTARNPQPRRRGRPTGRSAP